MHISIGKYGKICHTKTWPCYINPGWNGRHWLNMFWHLGQYVDQCRFIIYNYIEQWYVVVLYVSWLCVCVCVVLGGGGGGGGGFSLNDSSVSLVYSHRSTFVFCFMFSASVRFSSIIDNTWRESYLIHLWCPIYCTQCVHSATTYRLNYRLNEPNVCRAFF